jgi:hypothetical protein
MSVFLESQERVNEALPPNGAEVSCHDAGQRPGRFAAGRRTDQSR